MLHMDSENAEANAQLQQCIQELLRSMECNGADTYHTLKVPCSGWSPRARLRNLCGVPEQLGQDNVLGVCLRFVVMRLVVFPADSSCFAAKPYEGREERGHVLFFFFACRLAGCPNNHQALWRVLVKLSWVQANCSQKPRPSH